VSSEIALRSGATRSKSGDLAAVRELLDRTVGKCVQADFLERIEAIEASLRSQKRNAAHG